MHPTEPVKIHLDKPRTLRLTWRAMREIKAATGIDILAGGEFRISDPEVFPQVLCSMLSHEDRALTAEAVEDILDINNIEHAVEQVRLAIFGATPQPEESEGEGAEEEDREPPKVE